MFETVIGLEIHIQLNTRSKAFTGDPNDFQASPNVNAGIVTLAHPGTLPVMNRTHLDKGLLLALALGCEIKRKNLFDRKNYFYPDLPKGYQITQDKSPYCRGGEVRYLSGGSIKSVRLHHIHMEEDAGKSVHDVHDLFTLLDYNRAGVPLLELVTEPEFRSGQEVSDFLAELQKTVQYLGISDANMEEGSFRCDCNVSVRPAGATTLGERCEIKNLNSRRYAKNAIEYEAGRQQQIITSGGTIKKTTMLYDPDKNITRPMRKKESENDYRYFPDPDLPPVHVYDEDIAAISSNLCQLPVDRYQLLTADYGLSPRDAEVLLEEKVFGDCFLSLANSTLPAAEIAGLIVQKIVPHIRSAKEVFPNPELWPQISAFAHLTADKRVSKSAVLQHAFPLWMADLKLDPYKIAEKLDLLKSDDQDFLDPVISEVLERFPDKVAEYRKGKKGLIGFFMGQVKMVAGGKADPATMQAKLESVLQG